MKFLPDSHQSWPYFITDALIAVFFVGVSVAVIFGVI